jgi:hypothetical protein
MEEEMFLSMTGKRAVTIRYDVFTTNLKSKFQQSLRFPVLYLRLIKKLLLGLYHLTNYQSSFLLVLILSAITKDVKRHLKKRALFMKPAQVEVIHFSMPSSE